MTSPENGVAVKNDAAIVAALSNARPKIDAFPGGTGCSAAASAIDTTSPSCFSTLRWMWRSRQAVSEWLSPSAGAASPGGSDTPAVRIGRAAGDSLPPSSRCSWIFATSTVEGPTRTPSRRAGHEAREMDAQHVVAGGERLDHEPAARVGRRQRHGGAERRDQRARERAAPLVADRPLDAAEIEAGLLAGRWRSVWADTDDTVNPTIAATARTRSGAPLDSPPCSAICS